jgi:hypothetical protein
MENQIIGPTSFSFKGINWQKVLIGAGVAILGSLLTYFTTWITGQNFGIYTPIVVSIWSIIANVGRKWISDNE